MAGLTDTTIAASYDQLLIVDNNGGGNGTTHVAVKDGDGTTTFPLTLATDAVMITSTNRLEFGDNASYIHQSADGVLDLVSDTEIEINATTIDINGGATITTADNSDTLALVSTDTDANAGPNLRLYRNVGNNQAADDDFLGAIEFEGVNAKTDDAQDVIYSSIYTYASDVSDGTEDGSMYIKTMLAGTLRNTISLLPTEVVFNDEQENVDFRVESDGNANMFVVDAGNNRVGIGEASPDEVVHIKNANAAIKYESNTGSGDFTWNTGNIVTNGNFTFSSNTTNNVLTLANDGKIGIGTASPGDYSTSADNLVIYDAAHAGITIACPTNKSGNLFFADGTGDSDTTEHRGFIQYDHGNNVTDAMMIGTAGAEKMRITSDGRVQQKNTSIANSCFDIANSHASGYGASIQAGSGDNYSLNVQDKDGGDIVSFTANKSTFADKVGIGTTAPGALLDIAATSNDDYPVKIRGNIDNDGGFTGITFGYEADSGSYEKCVIKVEGTSGNVQPDFHILLNSDANGNNVSTDNTDARFTILNGGNVGIGTASPGTMLEIATNDNAYLTLNCDASGAGSDNAGILLEEAGTNVWAIRHNGGSSNRLEILDAGFDDGVIMAQGGTGFSDVSDERVKTDLVTISDAVDKINSLRAVNFKWKYGSEERRTKNNVGLIAQDVYKVLPEAVTVPEGDYEVTDHPVIEGEKQAQNTWAIDKSKLVPLLIKAVQELSAKVEALENA